MLNELGQLYRLILRVLGLEQPEDITRKRREILLYSEEGRHCILQRIQPRATAREQLWRISIKGGEPWCLLVALDSIPALRQQLGLVQADPGDSTDRLVRQITKEFPAAQYLISFVWQYRTLYPERYPNTPRPAQVFEVLFMEPIDLTGVKRQTHPAMHQNMVHKIMLFFLRFVFELEPSSHQSWKVRLSAVDWLRRLEAIVQSPKVLGLSHKLRLNTVNQPSN